MAINDLEYCRRHKVTACDRNLDYVQRVRGAGAYLRARAWRALNSETVAATVPQHKAINAVAKGAFHIRLDLSLEFEDSAMAARRLGRDRKSRHALREQVQLRVRAPKRQPVAQHDVDGLALFDQVRSPAML